MAHLLFPLISGNRYVDTGRPGIPCRYTGLLDLIGILTHRVSNEMIFKKTKRQGPFAGNQVKREFFFTY